MRLPAKILLVAFFTMGLAHSFRLALSADVKEYKSGIIWPEPAVIDPGPAGGPPADAMVLFDGTDLSRWKDGDKWIVKDGHAIAAKTGITSRDSFGDCQLHVEWASPPQAKGKGQGRGNSGIHLMERYEVQILDSYENKTYFDGQAGAIYKQRPPMVNACRKPGEWQTYDILFTAPRINKEGKLEKPATSPSFTMASSCTTTMKSSAGLPGTRRPFTPPTPPRRRSTCNSTAIRCVFAISGFVR